MCSERTLWWCELWTSKAQSQFNSGGFVFNISLWNTIELFFFFFFRNIWCSYAGYDYITLCICDTYFSIHLLLFILFLKMGGRPPLRSTELQQGDDANFFCATVGKLQKISNIKFCFISCLMRWSLNVVRCFEAKAVLPSTKRGHCK